MNKNSAIVNFNKQPRATSVFRDYPKVFVRYKMDGCRYCVESQPEWDALMNKIKNEYSVPDGVDIVEIKSNVVARLGLNANDVPSGFPSYAIVEDGVAKKLDPPISAFEGIMRNNGIIVKKGGTRRRRRRRRTRRAHRFFTGFR